MRGHSRRQAGSAPAGKAVTTGATLHNFSTEHSTVSFRHWPDLSSISLNPQLSPVPSDVVTNPGGLPPPTCFDPADSPSTPSIDDKPNQALLSMRFKAQREPATIDMNMNSYGSLLSSLFSPQESGGLSENSRLLSRNNGSAVRIDGRLHSVAPYGEIPSENGLDAQIADLHIVHVPPSFQTAALDIGSEVPSEKDSLRPSRRRSDPIWQKRIDDNGEEESAKRLKHTLEELERELMRDDEDESFICPRGLPDPSIRAGPSENGWWGFNIEDIRLKGAVFPTPAIVSSTMDLPAISPTCNIGDQGKHVMSVAKSEAPARTFGAQLSEATADVEDDPKHLLISCATAVAENDYNLARSIVTKLKSVYFAGDPIHRLAAYMTVGLVARIEQTVRGPNDDFRPLDPPSDERKAALQVLYRVCPYLRFVYLAANGAIAEAFKDEDKVHIIDFEIRQGNQWVALIRAFGARPGGSPQVRITGVEDPLFPVGGLQSVGTRLEELARSVGVPFEFHPVSTKMSEVEPGMLHTRPGEPFAVNFAYQLQCMPDESVSITNPRDRLLRMVRGMGPKVVTVVEQEANANTSSFITRFRETLSYYGAFFESLDFHLREEIHDLVSIEQLLGSVIVNIIACEGVQRFTRYERFGKWKARLKMAGFRPFPLCSYITDTIKSLLRNYPNCYRLKEEMGALFLGWRDRDLIVASAWQ